MNLEFRSSDLNTIFNEHPHFYEILQSNHQGNQLGTGRITVAARLSYSSCTKEIPVEYGTPYAEFEIKGTVTDTSNNPLEKAAVIIEIQNQVSKDTIKTDAAGSFDVSYTSSLTEQKSQVVTYYSDLKPDTTTVEFTESDL